MNDIVIIGLGQSFRGDDAAGLEAVRRWQAEHPSTSVRVEVVGLPGLQLLELLKGARAAIIVDAVQSGAPPGAIHLLHDAEIAPFTAGSDSAHGWGVAETLALGRQLSAEELPAQITLIGIEMAQAALGQPLSPAVTAALPRAVEAIETQVRLHHSSPLTL
jgi:hydrogenase maturation protease